MQGLHRKPTHTISCAHARLCPVPCDMEVSEAVPPAEKQSGKQTQAQHSTHRLEPLPVLDVNAQHAALRKPLLP
jgi:hypothetical protein